MCGITGYYAKEGFVSELELREMTDAIAHRGPDASGIFVEENVGLGHRRLSILDLNERSNQPFTSACQRYVISYNGEVYNFNKIAKDLGIEQKTSSDTEIIIEAFAKEGTHFISRLNGMFAFAIYDKELKSLHVYRDRMGIKQLYYFWDGENFAFASELKSLLKIDRIKKNLQINKSAVKSFLYMGYIAAPDSIYQNIYKLPSGSFAKVELGKLDIENYWNVENHLKSEVVSNEKQAKDELHTLLRKSIEYRLISDVPYGTFLSGGTDSSLVTSIAHSFKGASLNTFSIGFEEAKFNEATFAKQVANKLGTTHHEFILKEKQGVDLFHDIITTYDEPFADCSSIPTMLVSKVARQHVTMTLSGDGGDEMFLGYGFYNWANRLSNPLLKAARKPLKGALSKMGNRFERASHLFNYPKDRIKSHIFSQEQYYFELSEIDNVLVEGAAIPFILDEKITSSRKLSAAEEQAMFDLKYYLKDDLLVKVDRASMKYSLETRTPLLDHNIVEYAINIDEKLKVKNGDTKHLLKSILYDYVPKEMFDRPKWGFGIPVGKWLKNDLKFLIEDHLSKKAIEEVGLLNYNEVNRLVELFFNGKDYLYNRIWAMIILQKWHKDTFN